MKEGILYANQLIAGLVLSLASPFALSDITLESSWIKVKSVADIYNGTQDGHSLIAEGLAGMGVELNRSVSGSIPRAAVSTSSSASYSFADGVFSGNFQLDIATAGSTGGSSYPGAYARAELVINYTVSGSGGGMPTLAMDGTNFRSTTSQYKNYPNPGVISGISPSGQAAGPHTAVFVIDILDGDSADNGVTHWDARFHVSFANALQAPGFSETAPALPTVVVPQVPSGPGQEVIPPTFRFINAGSGKWHDPDVASGFHFAMTDGKHFTDILQFPKGFGADMAVIVDGVSYGKLGPGKSVSFAELVGHSVSSFDIVGIAPPVNPDDPTAFPIQLAFDAATASFDMTPINLTSAVPEPDTAVMWVLGIFVLARRLARLVANGTVGASRL